MAGYDCIMIPGAVSTGSALKPDKICGSQMGLVTATTAAATTNKTVCSKQYPFRITFSSDAYEGCLVATDECTGGNHGFKLRYFQTSC